MANNNHTGDNLPWLVSDMDFRQMHKRSCSELSTRTLDACHEIEQIDEARAALNLMDLNVILTPFRTSIIQVEEIHALLTAGMRHCVLLWTHATRDARTGLLNAAAMDAVLKQNVALAYDSATPLSIGLVDLDAFKSLNDTWRDHAIGDEGLRVVADRMLRTLREYDQAVIGRVGGDEFLFLLPTCDARPARVIAERIRACLADDPVRLSNGAVVAVTGSVGLATYDGHGQPDVRALRATAEQNLYQAKANGKNRVEPTLTV
jgi:diguanylate cyclase (GGDEF)-like protein